MPASTDIALPLAPLPLPDQRYSCQGCGECCKQFTVQLSRQDLEKLAAQGWAEKLGEPVTVEFGGHTFLRQKGGGCIFLMEDGLCRIHAEHGLKAKPLACQLFPFTITRDGPGLQVGMSFACPTVCESTGAELRTHLREVKRLAVEAPFDRSDRQVMLTVDLPAEAEEIAALQHQIDGWMRRDDVALEARLDGLAWVTQSLAAARLRAVRRSRFRELLIVLFSALPHELDHLPVEPPTARQRKVLRQSAFARVENPTLETLERGRLRTGLDQLARQRRFAAGRGEAPRFDNRWPDPLPLDQVEDVDAAHAMNEIAGIDDVVSRYSRAMVLGGRAWGAGHYHWPITHGLTALTVTLASIGWLARLHAAARDLDAVDALAVREAVRVCDRSAGRARWLGSRAERMRLTWLWNDDGLRRLMRAYAPTTSGATG